MQRRGPQEEHVIRVRKSDDRGHFDHGWLDTRHTFSFADYHDPAHMGFRSLRVINEDRVRAGVGFGTHGHRDMEILSYVIDGELAHDDSMGNGSVIVPGDVQRMSAGRGVQHSEFNPSKTAGVHFLQIWIVPEAKGLTPGYEQKAFPVAERRGKLRLVASRDGAEGSVTVHQDVRIYAALLDAGQSTTLALAERRHSWVQVVRGAVRVNGVDLVAGDGARASEERELRIDAVADAELLAFDLA